MRHRVPVIAVIDDDASFRRALQRLLRAAGFTVEAFASAQDFLGIDHWRQMACLVLDIRLPGMTGFELQEHLAALG
jgi:FixJ family two-component response regulator